MTFTLKASGGPAHSAPLDAVQINRAMNLFLDPDHYVFLQSLPHAVWACLPCCETSKIEQWASKNQDSNGMYFGINPIVQVDRPSRVGDVVYRRWILVDIDRNKTLQPDDPSTENEHEDAKELAFEIQSFLGDAGFPAPVQVDSGNGFHLYYRINFPNDADHRDLVHEFLSLLANSFDGDRGNVGSECFDARRISRIPGTWSRRGTASKNRPYRQSKFVYMPKDILEVPAEVLRDFVGGTAKEAPDTPTPFELVARNGSPDRVKAYGLRALDLECGKLAGTLPNNRNNQLFKSAAALFQLVAAGALNAGDVKDALFVAANRCGLTDDKEVTKTIESGQKAGMSQPRVLPEEMKEGKHKAKQPFDQNEMVTIQASLVQTREVEWLWPSRIPIGKMTTFAGMGGIGKTFVLCDIAARVSQGIPWPDKDGGRPAPGKTLYISGEDDPDDTLVPRMIACGAYLKNIYFLRMKAQDYFSLSDQETLNKAMQEMGNDVRLIVVDPPASFITGVDNHKDNEIRTILSPLKEWVEKNKVALVFNTHLNKGGTGKMEAMARVMGSVAWVNAVRAAHLFASDGDDPEKVLFVPMKMNLCKKKKALAYKLQSLGACAKVEWLGEVDITANEAISSMTPQKTQKIEAKEWLIEKFSEQREWPSAAIFTEAKYHNISGNALKKVKGELGIFAKKITDERGTQYWIWFVSPDWKHAKKGDANEEPIGF